MRKGFTVSAALALLLSAAAFADIGQIQGFLVGAGADVVTNSGSVDNINAALVQNNQQGSDAGGRVLTVQTGLGSLVQGASASSLGGVFGAEQDGLAAGGQIQLHTGGPWNFGLQAQDLDAGLTQQVFGLGGVGTALAVQSLVAGQVQLILTPYGASANVQYAGVALFDALGGGPGGNIVVSGGTSVGADQTHVGG